MRRFAVLVAALLLAAAPAWAQKAGKPGEFDYLVLSLSWSPSWCASEAGEKDKDQCGPNKRFGFIVHGLWPQHAKGYPAQCVAEPQPVPREVADRIFPVMPSRKLIEHEWAKHGTCFGGSPAEYFDRTKAAFGKVRIPDRLKAPEKPVTLTVAEVERLFAEANPGLKPEAVAVTCRGRRAAEVRVCMGKDLSFRTCGSDVTDRCRGDALFQPVK